MKWVADFILFYVWLLLHEVSFLPLLLPHTGNWIIESVSPLYTSLGELKCMNPCKLVPLPHYLKKIKSLSPSPFLTLSNHVSLAEGLFLFFLDMSDMCVIHIPCHFCVCFSTAWTSTPSCGCPSVSECCHLCLVLWAWCQVSDCQHQTSLFPGIADIRPDYPCPACLCPAAGWLAQWAVWRCPKLLCPAVSG